MPKTTTTKNLDKLTRRWTAFHSFAELLAASTEHNYCPTLCSVPLADAFDAASPRPCFRRRYPRQAVRS